MDSVKSSCSSPRILAIQSHVVQGYVGNKSATFPLQLLGWDVDALNTVQFSNHLGYGHNGGHTMTVDHLRSCIDGLDRNGLLNHTALLTGFTPGTEGVEALQEFVAKLRSNNPQAVYLMDPVMGDNGKLYVHSEVPERYKSLLFWATIVTPNDFECELLTGICPSSLDRLLDCFRAFHTQYNTPHVVITSVALAASTVAHLTGTEPPIPDSDGNVLVCAGSSRVDAQSPDEAWAIVFPRLAQAFSGVGDLFASVLLGHFLTLPHPDRLARAAELALATVQGIIQSTMAGASKDLARLANSATLEPSEIRLATARALELKIVQNRQHIEHPEAHWKACLISSGVAPD